jgi:transposase
MLGPATRILLCTRVQDMRRSFDRLAAVVRDELGEEPQSGALYVFVGRSRTRVKVLWWERNGYCLLYKRLHRALFDVPAAREGETRVVLDPRALAELLAGVEQKSKGKATSMH